MGEYMMEYGGKRYATDAENIMEAEDKLVEHLEIVDLSGPCKTTRIDSLKALGDKSKVIFF